MLYYIYYERVYLYDLFEDIWGNKENQTNLPAICVQKPVRKSGYRGGPVGLNAAQKYDIEIRRKE